MTDETTLALTFKRYAQQFAMNEELFLDMDASVQRDFLRDQLLFRLTTKILTDDLPPEQITARHYVTYEVPTSTWQMWKKRHAHRWYARRLVARWSVRYEPDPEDRGVEAVCTFNLERYRTYPRAQVRVPKELGPTVLMHAIRDLRWGEESGT